MLQDNPIFESMCDETRRVLETLTGKFDCTGVAVSKDDGEFRDGFIPFTFGGFRADVLIPLSETAQFLESVGAKGSIAGERFHAKAFGAKLEDWCRESELPIPEFPEIETEADVRMFWKVYDGLVKQYGIDLSHDFDGMFDGDGYAMLRIGFHLEKPGHDSNGKPFYCYATINFDEPYFRSQGEIARNVGPDAPELEILLGEADGEEPETIGEFSAILAEMVKSAFPEADLSRPGSRDWNLILARLGIDESGPKA